MNEDRCEASVPTSYLEQVAGDKQVETCGHPALDSPCCVHVHSRRHKFADADGISAKAAIDGLIHAGILANDSPEQVKSVTFSQEKIGKKEIEETIITIMTVEAA